MRQAAPRTKQQATNNKNNMDQNGRRTAMRVEALGCRQQQRGRKLASSLDQIKPMPGRGHAHDGFPGKLRRLRLTGTATSSHAQVALLKAVPLPDKVI
jgi:hypothetical protein